jgi:hypothetical protein
MIRPTPEAGYDDRRRQTKKRSEIRDSDFISYLDTTYNWMV